MTMNKKVLTVCLILLACVLAFMFVFTVFFKHTDVSAYSELKDWPEFSIETLFSGEYFSDLMYCFTDHIPMRDKFIEYESKIRALYGVGQDEEIHTVEGSDEFNSGDDPDISADPSSGEVISDDPSVSKHEFDEVSFDENSAEESTEQSQDGAKGHVEMTGTIIVLSDIHRGLEVYNGSESNSVRFAELLNSLAENIPENVNFYSVVVPKASAYYIWQSSVERFAKTAGNNKRDIDIIADNISDRITNIDVYNTLGVHSDEAIYYRTDHHWTALGAYYGAREIAKAMGVPFNDLSEYNEVVRPDYVGTFSMYSNNSPAIMNYPEDFVYYESPNAYTAEYYDRETFKKLSSSQNGGSLLWHIDDSKRSSWYSTFIRGDKYCVKIKSGVCNNGRKLLIVKDSYGNAIPQYLLGGFEEIYVVDAREYKRSISETVKEFGITDLLSIECTFSAVGGQYYNLVKEIYN